MDNRVIEPMFTTTVQVLYEMGMEARIEAEPCVLPAELQKADPFRGPLQGSKTRKFPDPSEHQVLMKSVQRVLPVILVCFLCCEYSTPMVLAVVCRMLGGS